MTTERISLEHVELPELPSGLLGRIWNTITRWRERVEARETLARIDARICQDIGITEADLWRETRLPFWRDRL